VGIRAAALRPARLWLWMCVACSGSGRGYWYYITCDCSRLQPTVLCVPLGARYWLLALIAEPFLGEKVRVH
jgi:hypothetical protein